RRFGIKVREITLFPIGGIASIAKVPEKPAQELFISLAGPAFNILVILVFFFPAKIILGPEVLFHPLSTDSWPLTVAYVYWINLVLAVFNLLPAFPMDGGRVLRALLATRLGYQKATKIAVALGHVFALVFAYIGIVRFNVILIVISVFIYMAASNEELQVDIKETLKKFKVCDILPRDFLTVTPDVSLSKVLELVFHSHQEDFPVLEDGELIGFISRQDIMKAVHRHGTAVKVSEIMRRKFPVAKDTDSLMKVHNLMRDSSTRAMPVMKGPRVVGVVTLEDISRVYAMVSHAA
ncbi:MAG: CBS domain-containing protein, partial [Candidatus Omnitrophica bacterium]|nr:CBS domain-containing protein [Candidatus Omnitrophota bacterium]